jgi:hypothetical protein
MNEPKRCPERPTFRHRMRRADRLAGAAVPLVLAIAVPAARAQAPAPGGNGTAIRRPATVTHLPRLTLSSPGATSPADLVLPSGVFIAGRHVPWSQATTLSDGDAIAFENGRCVFDLSYDVANTGLTATPPFENWVRAMPRPPLAVGAIAEAATVASSDQPSTKTALALGPRESRRVHTRAVAATGSWALVVRVDPTGAVPETNKQNNEQRIGVTVMGGCGSTPPGHPPTAHYLSTEVVLAHVRLAGIEPSSALPLEELDGQNAKGYQRGKCLFEVSYEVKNDGPAATTAFHSAVSVTKALSYQEPPLPPLAPGQVVPVKVLAAFRPGENEVAILAFNHAAPFTDENYWHRVIFVHGTCTPPRLVPAASDSGSKRGAGVSGLRVPEPPAP